MDTAVRSAVRSVEARLPFRPEALQSDGIVNIELLGLSLTRGALHHHKRNDLLSRTIEFAHRLSRQLGGFRVPPCFD